MQKWRLDFTSSSTPKLIRQVFIIFYFLVVFALAPFLSLTVERLYLTEVVEIWMLEHPVEAVSDLSLN
jgi:hypothetical protein